MIGGKGGNNGKGEKWYKEHINSMLQIQWKNPVFIENHKKRCSQNLKGSPNSKRFKDKNHSEKTREQMRNSHIGKHLGEKNSQFGTHWITDGKEIKKISNQEIIPIGWKIGRKI